MKLLVYLENISNRAQYIFGLLLTDLLGLEVAFTDKKEEFLAFDGPRISYGDKPLGDELFIRSTGLLFETGVAEKQIEFIEYNGFPAFFGTADQRSIFPFDLFSASFFLVSRYEEYLPFKHDEYGRFPVMESTAARGGFLRIPVINRWSEMLGKELQKRFPGLHLAEREYRFIPTIDIDHAYAYKHRNFLRTFGGIVYNIFRKRGKQLGLRIRVLLGVAKDPYDTYEYIHQVHKDRGLKPIFFILYSQKRRHDNNITLSGKAFRHLVKSLDHRGAVGIHPSLGSNRKFTKLESEIIGLTEVLGHKITLSRQHFLKVSFPRTYQNLIHIGIRHDYSMGFASEPGFKAGIADPFTFYNLINEAATHLTIHPITLMDVTLRDYYRLDPMTATEFARSLIDEVKAVNGEFVSLWHNENLSEMGRWKGWRQVYEEILNYAAEKPKGK